MSKTNALLGKDSVLLREDEGSIATLTLNRPEKFNALSYELMDLIQNQLDELAADNLIRVVVVAANGSAFCTGHDLLEMYEDPSSLAMGALFDQCSQIMISLTQLPQPVIAKVQGMATAAGCQLVAQCDLAIAAEEVQFATSGINIGLFCGTPMVSLTRNLPRKKAMEMLLTGEFINAPTAVQYGLINYAVPLNDLDKSVKKLADSIAKQGPAFISEGKKLFYRQIENSISEAYQEASKAMVKNMQKNDTRKGIKAFLEKCAMPKWQDR